MHAIPVIIAHTVNIMDTVTIVVDLFSCKMLDT
jgi:hypothetical protein